MSNCSGPPGLQLTRLLFELVLMRWMKLEPILQSEVSQKVKHGIFQARVLEWGAIAFSVYMLEVYNIMFHNFKGYIYLELFAL